MTRKKKVAWAVLAFWFLVAFIGGWPIFPILAAVFAGGASIYWAIGTAAGFRD